MYNKFELGSSQKACRRMCAMCVRRVYAMCVRACFGSYKIYELDTEDNGRSKTG